MNKKKVEDMQEKVHDQQRIWIEDRHKIIEKWGENFYYLVNSKFNELIDELDLAISRTEES